MLFRPIRVGGRNDKEAFLPRRDHRQTARGRMEGQQEAGGVDLATQSIEGAGRGSTMDPACDSGRSIPAQTRFDNGS